MFCLSFPAIMAIRKRFPNARITVIAGKIPAQFIGKLGLVDDVMPIDRVALLRGNKLRSIGQIFKFVGEVRRRKFDFVIDLHSLSESNLLGFLSGAKATFRQPFWPLAELDEQLQTCTAGRR